MPKRLDGHCWFCDSPGTDAKHRGLGDWSDFTCPRCGPYALSGSAIAALEHDRQALSKREQAVLSHAIRRRQRGENRPRIDWDTLELILKDDLLPTVSEQAELLIVWLGQTLEGPGAPVILDDLHHGGIVGAMDTDGILFVIDGLEQQGLLSVSAPTNVDRQVTLSFEGWDRYQALRRGRGKGLRAFMAMKFGNPELDRIYVERFKPAANAAGFDLRKVNEEPTPGLIDNRIRVEILESRFVVADLSDDNLGAYWEAGYAEGLGKPVIYTCDKRKFESEGTHFDTNHSLTIPWDLEDPSTAAAMLKATIRTRFPGEAKMSDDEAK